MLPKGVHPVEIFPLGDRIIIAEGIQLLNVVFVGGYMDVFGFFIQAVYLGLRFLCFFVPFLVFADLIFQGLVGNVLHAGRAALGKVFVVTGESDGFRFLHVSVVRLLSEGDGVVYFADLLCERFILLCKGGVA